MSFYIKVVNLESYLVSGTFVKNCCDLLDVLFIVKTGDIKIY